MYSVTELKPLPGYSLIYTSSVNNVGQVVGFSRSSRGYDRAFLWSEGTGMQDLGALVGQANQATDSSQATDINDAGQVVGFSRGEAFLWSESTGMQDLETLVGESSRVTDINDAGQVVGLSRSSRGYDRAFLWSESTGMQDLGTLSTDPNMGYSGANAINNAGQVVGRWWSNPEYVIIREGAAPLPRQSRAFLWSVDTGMQDLNSLLAASASSGWTLFEGIDVNDGGQSVGRTWGDEKIPDLSAYVLTPAEEGNAP